MFTKVICRHNGCLMRFIIIALVVATVTACGSPSEHYQNGLIAQQAGDPEKALKEFEAAKDYGDAKQQVAVLHQALLHLRTSYDEAQQAIKNNEWAKAEPILREISKQYPQFKDSQQLHSKVVGELEQISAEAERFVDEGKLREAARKLELLGDYKDGRSRAVTLQRAIPEMEHAYEQAQQAVTKKEAERNLVLCHIEIIG